jgi:hypothetical protein
MVYGTGGPSGLTFAAFRFAVRKRPWWPPPTTTAGKGTPYPPGCPMLRRPLFATGPHLHLPFRKAAAEAFVEPTNAALRETGGLPLCAPIAT